MTVYVDDLIEYKKGINTRGLSGVWCHMMTDGDIDELHNMAQAIKLKREWFQDDAMHNHPHYDLSETKRAAAIWLGAKPVSGAEMVKRCSALFKRITGG